MVDGKKLYVSASPHVRSKDTARGIMLDVIIALLPTLVWSSAVFGLRVLAVTAVSVATCVLSEFIMRKFVLKRHNTIGDLSAVVTGMLLAFNVPSNIPYWMIIIGGIFAIVVAKQCFGGIGQNFVNPAIAGRIFMLLSFSGAMSSWPIPRQGMFNFSTVDVVTAATPLKALAEGGETPTTLEMLLGLRGGCIGETCIIALVIGFIYLLARKVITITIPASFIGTVAVIMLIAGKGDFGFAAKQLLSGGLFLGAIYMATDYTTSPITQKGKLIFGIGCGLFTCLIRLFGSLPEGVSYSIILMNVLCPLIEKATTPKPFGTPKKEKKAKKEEEGKA